MLDTSRFIMHCSPCNAYYAMFKTQRDFALHPYHQFRKPDIMPLTLTDLTLLIELVERELVDLRDNIVNDAEFADDYQELLVQVGVTSDHLRAEYKSQWTEDSDLPPYDDLIVEIEGMFAEDVDKNL